MVTWSNVLYSSVVGKIKRGVWFRREVKKGRENYGFELPKDFMYLLERITDVKTFILIICKRHIG